MSLRRLRTLEIWAHGIVRVPLSGAHQRTMSSPIDADLDGHYKAGCADAAFRNQLARTKEKVAVPARLIDPKVENLPCGRLVLPLARRLVGQMQSKYKIPRRLRLVFHASDQPNAFAIWTPGIDWIVVSCGLLERLKVGAKAQSQLLLTLSEPEADSLLGVSRTLAEQPSDLDELASILEEMLFGIGLTFLICHEVGHHARGHESYYKAQDSLRSQVIDEHDLWKQKDLPLDRYALELDADNFAVERALKMALDFLQFRKLPYESATASEQLGLAHFVFLCVFMAIFVIVPGKFEQMLSPTASHPAGALRALWMMHDVIQALKARCPDSRAVDGLSLVAISALGMASASALAVTGRLAKPLEEVSFYETFRIAGTQRLLHDDAVTTLINAIRAAYFKLQPHLQPRWKTSLTF